MNHSVYEYVVYESKVEKEFAKKLDQREDIRLFVKLPGWFEIDTPVGKYNPDWAIIKHNDHTLYLVRETKSTKDEWRCPREFSVFASVNCHDRAALTNAIRRVHKF